MLLETRHLVKRFGGLKAINDIDVTIPTGELLLIMGPNGSGKTTFFNLLSGVLLPSAGQILLQGRDVTGLRAHAMARLRVSRTFQNVRLFGDSSVLENVLVGRHARSRISFLDAALRTPHFRREEEHNQIVARSALEFVGLWEERDRQAGELPYGHQRRLEIARALTTEPELLLLDEPAAGMNAVEVDDLLALIRSIHERGTTIILIEHQMRLAMQVARRVVVFDGGQKIAEGRPEEIQRNPQVIEAYMGTETD
jgi:branched-chain amino acid transport system ATP-binding protein